MSIAVPGSLRPLPIGLLAALIGLTAAADSFTGGTAWDGARQVGYPIGIGRTVTLDGRAEALYGWSYQQPFTTGAAVVGRRVFYNGSAFDGGDLAATTADDRAIATDKAALRPGETAGFENYTSYSRGLNGILIDLADAPGMPSAADFRFKVGNDDLPSAWPAGPAPVSITVRPGAGVLGSTRVTIVWADRAIAGRWLEVQVLPTAATGLASADVFYFGNAIGETGDRAGVDARVDAADEAGARAQVRSLLRPAPITSAYDFNRDRQVDATDQILARLNPTDASTALRLIHPAARVGPASPALAGGGGRGMAAEQGRVGGTGVWAGVISTFSRPEGQTPGLPATGPTTTALRVFRLSDGLLRLDWPGVPEGAWTLEWSLGDGRWNPVSRERPSGIEPHPDGGWRLDPGAERGARLYRGVGQAR